MQYYFVLPFRWAEGVLAAGEVMQLPCAVAAEEVGELLSATADGVLVYMQWRPANPSLWEPVEILASHGVVGEPI